MPRTSRRSVASLAALLLIVTWVACKDEGDGNSERREEKDDETEQPAPRSGGETPGGEPAAPPSSDRALLLAQARFETGEEGPKPQPARLVIAREKQGEWTTEFIEDPSSNVFHAAIWWRDGILTLGGTEARLRHWKKKDGSWSATTLWERSWGGRFDRLRDVEIADADGDGEEEIVLATHDRGVVAVGSEQGGSWEFTELGGSPDTFVHEVEVGDADGDGAPEIYATPSDRNRSSGTSQPGAVIRYRWKDGRYRRDLVARWSETHAKEILVTDLDGDGNDELYAVREAVVEAGDGESEIAEPVTIFRARPGEDGWKLEELVSIDDRQARFLVPGDVDDDGDLELVLSGMKSGLWRLEQEEGGGLQRRLIDERPGGFEHAVHVTDLDEDGAVEIYAASDDERLVRRYRWDGRHFEREVILRIPAQTFVWRITDAPL